MTATKKLSFQSKENESENLDFFGNRWRLAPGGKKRVDTSQTRVWELHVELNGFGALFRNMTNCELTADELYGVSMSLQRMGKRLSRISDELSRALVEVKPEDK